MEDTIGGIHYLDSPSTTSAVTYTGYYKAGYGGTAGILVEVDIQL